MKAKQNNSKPNSPPDRGGGAGDSEALLQMALRAAEAGSWSVDAETKAVEWSPESYRILGFDPAQGTITFPMWVNRIHADDRLHVVSQFKQNLNNKKPFELEYRIVHADGRVCWIQNTNQMVLDASGVPMRTIGILLDITRRKHDEEALRKLNRAYRMLSYCNQSIIWAEDEAALLETACHIIVDYGQYALAFMAAATDTANIFRPLAIAGGAIDMNVQVRWEGMPTKQNGTAVSGAYIVTDPRTSPGKNACDEYAVQQGCTTLVTLPLIINGKTFALLRVGTRDEQGFSQEEVDTLIEVVNNLNYAVTALRTRAEHARAEAALRETNEYFSQLAEHIGTGFYLFDVPTQRILYANPVYMQLFGEISDDHDPDAYMNAVHPEDRAELFAAVEAQRLNGVPLNLEFRLLKPDGSIAYSWVHGFFVRDSEGKITRTGGLIEDITARKQAEQREVELRLRAETFATITMSLSSHISLDKLLDEILEQAQRLVPYKSANIALLEGDMLRIKRARGYPDDKLILGLRLSLAELPVDAEPIATQRAMIITNTDTDKRWLKMSGFDWIRSFMGVPIVVQGRVLGLLRLDSENAGQFSEADAERLLPLVSAAAMALENANLYEQAQQEIAIRKEAQYIQERLNRELEDRVRLRTREYLHSKQRIEIILDSSSDGILFAYPDTGIQQVNRAFNTLFRSQDDDYFDQPMTVLTRPEDALLLGALLDAVMEDGATRRIEIVMVRKDGTQFEAEIGIAYMKWTDSEEGIVCSLRDISLRKQIEAALRSSEAQMRAVLDGTYTFIGLLEPDGKLIVGNKAALASIGMPDDQSISGQYFWKLSAWHTEAIRQVLQESIHRAAQGEFIRYETEMMTVNDGVITIDFSLSPIKDENGQVILLVPEGRDISEKKRAEDALRITTHQLQAILDNSSALIYISDLQGNVMMINRQYERSFNLKQEEVIGKSWASVLSESTVAKLYPHNEQVLEKGAPMEFEETARQADSNIHTYLSVKSPLFDEHGNIYAICGISTDITERKKTEEQIRYHANLLDKVSDAIISTDPDFIVRSWNRAAELIYGWSAKEVIGKNVTELLKVRFPSGDAHESVKDKFLADGYWTGEAIQQRKDGTNVYVLASVTLLSDENGTPFGTVAVNRDIGERKQAEEALKRSEADLRSVFDSTQLAFMLLDTDLRIRAVNVVAQMQFRQLLNVDIKVGDTYYQYNDYEAQEALIARFNRILAGESLSREAALKIGNSTRYYQMAYNPVVTGDGKVVGICVTGEEVTERKQVEEAIKRSEADLRSVFDSTPLALMLLDKDYKVRAANAVTQLMTRTVTNKDMLIGDSVLNYVPPGTSEAYATILERSLKGESQNLEISFNEPQGSYYFHMTYNPVITGDGDIIGICVTSEDITERKRAEEALKRSEADLRSVFDSTPLGLILLDKDFKIRAINSVAQGYAQLIFKKDVPTGDDIIRHALVQEAEENAARYRRVLAGASETREVTLSNDEVSKHYYINYNPVIEGDSTIIGIIITMEDITERKHSEIELRQALEKQKELGDLKTRFVSMASHEFRTPLATIQAASDALKVYIDKMTPEQINHRLNKIQLQIKHMVQLLTDVLTLEQIQVGKLQYQPNEFDLVAFCREIIADLHTDRPQRIVFDCPLDTLGFYADEKLMRQVIVNVLTNALKYSPEDKSVELGLRRDDEAVTLTFRDEGIGIPLKDQEHLFEPFYRATNVGTTSGSGLGLIIAKQAVEMHSGSMTFESQSEEGTTFTVIFPHIRESTL